MKRCEFSSPSAVFLLDRRRNFVVFFPRGEQAVLKALGVDPPNEPRQARECLGEERVRRHNYELAMKFGVEHREPIEGSVGDCASASLNDVAKHLARLWRALGGGELGYEPFQGLADLKEFGRSS